MGETIVYEPPSLSVSGDTATPAPAPATTTHGARSDDHDDHDDHDGATASSGGAGLHGCDVHRDDDHESSR